MLLMSFGQPTHIRKLDYQRFRNRVTTSFLSTRQHFESVYYYALTTYYMLRRRHYSPLASTHRIVE